MILFNPELHSPYQARAMNYLECYTIGRELIFSVANGYPRSRKILRRNALLMALRRRLAMVASEKINDCHISEINELPVLSLGTQVREVAAPRP